MGRHNSNDDGADRDSVDLNLVKDEGEQIDTKNIKGQSKGDGNKKEELSDWLMLPNADVQDDNENTQLVPAAGDQTTSSMLVKRNYSQDQ